MSTSDARYELGFSASDTVVLFVATGSRLPRKGYSFLKRALEEMREDSSVRLLTVGGGLPETPKGIRHLHIDHVSDEKELYSIYSAADVPVMWDFDQFEKSWHASWGKCPMIRHSRYNVWAHSGIEWLKV